MNAYAKSYAPTIQFRVKQSVHSSFSSHNASLNSNQDLLITESESDDLQEQDNDENSENELFDLFFNADFLKFQSSLKKAGYLFIKESLSNSLLIFHSVLRI